MANLNGHDGGNAGNSQGEPKEPSEGGKLSAERVEGRGQAKGNADPQNTPRTLGREGVLSARDRIRQAAKTDKEGGLLRSCTTSTTQRACARRTSASSGTRHREWTGRPGGPMDSNWKQTLRTCPTVCEEGRTERRPSGGSTSPSRTDGRGRWGSPRSRTSWSSVPWRRS